MTAPTTGWRSVVPRSGSLGSRARAVGRHRSEENAVAARTNGPDESCPHQAHRDGQVLSMVDVGLGGVPGARVAGRYRLTRPAPAHGSPPPAHDPSLAGAPLAPPAGDPASRVAARQPVPGQLWLAQDEVLGRQVLVRLLPLSDPAAESLLGAARRAARLVDQGALAVLDAAVGHLSPPDDPAQTQRPEQHPDQHLEQHRAPSEGLPRVVYVVGEWVQAVDLATLLADGPLPGREAARIAGEVARVLGHAHGEGLAHRQVVPEDVLLTDTGRVALAGLGVEAALHGQDETATEEARLADLRAAGAVLYAGLTARWPLESSCSGTALPAAPREGHQPCAPRQVRAAVPTELDDLACRALGAPRRGQPPVGSADELAELLERAGSGRTGGSRTGGGWAGGRWDEPGWDGGWTDRPGDLAEPDDEPTGTWPVAAESRRTVGAAAAVVATVLAAGVALLTWQVLAPADVGPRVLAPNPGAAAADDSARVAPGEGPLRVATSRAFDPEGDGHEDDATAVLAADGDAATAWTTQTYYGSPALGGLKDGVGLVVDLGSVREVRTVGLDLLGRGTDLQVRAAVVPAGTAVGSPGSASPPARLDGFPVMLGSASDTGSSVAVRAPEPVTTRYLLVWLTSLPPVSPTATVPGAGDGSGGTALDPGRTGPGGPSGPTAYRGGVAEVRVSGPDTLAR